MLHHTPRPERPRLLGVFPRAPRFVVPDREDIRVFTSDLVNPVDAAAYAEGVAIGKLDFDRLPRVELAGHAG